MKFTKEDASKELVAKMTANGESLSMSQRSITECTDNLYTVIASEEMELSDFVEKALPFFKTANSNIRNDVSAGIKKYKEDNPAPQKEPVKNETKSDEEYSRDELLKRLEAMEKRMMESEMQTKRNAIKSTIVSKLNEKGLTDKEWIDAFLDEVPVTEDIDIEGEVEKYLNLYNKSKASVNPDITPNGSGGSSDALNDMFAKAREFREKKLKEQGIIKN